MKTIERQRPDRYAHCELALFSPKACPTHERPDPQVIEKRYDRKPEDRNASAIVTPRLLEGLCCGSLFKC